MKKIRIGFIGAGGITRRHLGVLQHFKDIQIAAFSDVHFPAAQELAQHHQAEAYPSHQEMLEKENLDAVYICVPPFAHGQVEWDVIAKKLPFFVEKPLAVDLQTAENIAKQVAESDTITAVGYHWRYLDVVERAQEMLRERPARLALGYWLDATPPPAWWHRRKQSGGQMVEQTTHIFDLVRHLVGEVTSVQAFGSHLQRNHFPDLDIEDVSVANLSFASGAVGTVASTCLLNWSHRVGLHLFSEGMALEITDREIMTDIGQGRPVTHSQIDPVVREDRDFINAVQGRENHIRVPYAEALQTHRLVCAAMESLQNKQVVNMPMC
jgi:predicted dehydrogenase